MAGPIKLSVLSQSIPHLAIGYGKILLSTKSNKKVPPALRSGQGKGATGGVKPKFHPKTKPAMQKKLLIGGAFVLWGLGANPSARLYAQQFARLEQPSAATEARYGKSANAVAPKAQKVSGTVKDEKGDNLPGVSVIVKDSQQGTTTDASGEFNLMVPNKEATLVFSFVGYVKQEIVVGNRTTINVSLKADVNSLEEVVVIGYGAVRKKDLTGSVVQLKGEELKEVPTANVLEAAQGKIAGADITRSSGQAGAKVNISIRGNRSIGGNNSPLIIVDGIQYSNLEDINANDIEYHGYPERCFFYGNLWLSWGKRGDTNHN